MASLHKIDLSAQQFYDLCNEAKRREIHDCLSAVDEKSAVVTLAYALANAVVVLCKDDLAAVQTFDGLVPAIRDQILQMANDPGWLDEVKRCSN